MQGVWHTSTLAFHVLSGKLDPIDHAFQDDINDLIRIALARADQAACTLAAAGERRKLSDEGCCSAVVLPQA